MRIAVVIGLISMVGLGVGCQHRPASTARAPSATPVDTATNLQTYAVTGVVKKLMPEEKMVSIQHEKIANFMDAMTMPFHVRDTNELAGLKPGDAITFRLSVTSDRSWIDQIKKTEAQPAAEAPSERPAFRQVRDVDPLKIGDLLPDYHFTNELGQVVRFNDYRGQALALTFIFTRCPMPDFCPLMSKKFSDTYKLLTNMPNAPANWHLFSLSFDPNFDTPTVLRNYAQRYHYDPVKWNFITGALIDIDAITDQFELPVLKEGENWNHKLRTAVIDAQGKVQKIFIYNQWTPQELADEIIKAAQAQ